MNTDAFIGKYWGRPGGAERATYQMFLTELAQLLGAETPDPGEANTLGDYQFEGPVSSEAVFLSKHNKRIDLYKRDCFILEAKQSQLKPGETLPPDPPEAPLEPVRDLFGNIVDHRPSERGRAPRYDRLMASARIQAERYSLALPSGHKPPPFLIVADIGRAFELYFDWTGDGRGYGFFPDQQSYRITLEQLADEKVRDLLRGIWLDPVTVDPRRRAVEVTSDIADDLSKVAEQLELDERQRHPGKTDSDLALGIESTSLFVMRLLFCMFAEDVGLLPEGRFTALLEEAAERDDRWWQGQLSHLWRSMNTADHLNRFWSFGGEPVKHFNGNLFADCQVYALPRQFKERLVRAAKRDWRKVEPAIFGTLLEQVLTSADRAKLGAHYTPRPYVQRLVNATIGDVLTPEWEAVRDAALESEAAGERPAAIASIRAFQDRLCALRILDPACGTGNFLYVAMELLLQLEGEAIQLAAELGEVLPPQVEPKQLLGLELNPRAAVIAELVLWIGWLRHRLANHPQAIGDPVLPTLSNINGGTHGGFDAVLRRTGTGEVDAANPMLPDWPEADFIVGNPPFIGGKDLREKLDDAESLWRANPRVPKSADLVMHWWDRAAHILTTEGTRLRRFGLVTTNSITQTFSRRVIENYLAPPGSDAADGLGRLSLILAIPDHPWTKTGKDAAAVRIAMTVARAGVHEGTLIEITHEEGLSSDSPRLTERGGTGRINADLSLGCDVTAVVPLKANDGLASPGVKLHGAGFIVSPPEAAKLGLGTREGLEAYIRPYRNGRDLLQTSRGKMVIDLFGLSEKEVRQRFHEVHQHLMATVKPERDVNRRASYARHWWVHGEPRREMRPALASLPRYIATVETSKHRIFQFLDASILPDNKLINIGSADAVDLGILSSAVHVQWSLLSGGWLGVGNDSVYVKSRVFDPFPFPDATPEQRAAIADLSEELDATRKTALAEVPELTMTQLYNMRELLRGGIALSPQQQDAARDARAGIVARLHDQIDAEVAAAYGWPSDLAPSEIVSRLVALNAERAAEERAGTIRWMRPEYQIPKFAP